jgi:sarcosine oxidase subunit gamma
MLDTGVPLSSSGLSGNRVTVRPLPAKHQWSLRARMADVPRLADAWQAPLPTDPLSSTSLSDRHAFRLGPDEWLLIADAADAAHRLASLPQTPAFSLVDISHRELAWSIEGPDAARLLRAGCPLDFDETAFPARRATRSMYGQAEVTLWRPNHESIWQMQFPRSFRDYMTRHLAQAIANL